MDLAFDVETYERGKEGTLKPRLDGTGKYFLIGSITNEKGKSRVFDSKEKMWEYILEKGKRARRNGHTLYAFAHNIKYDFFNIYRADKNLAVLSEFPFIATYYIKREKIIPLEKWDGYKAYLDINKRKYEYSKTDKIVICRVKEEAVRFVDSLSIFKMSLKNLGELVGLEKMEMPEEMRKGDTEKIRPYATRDTEILIEAVRMLKRKLKEDGVKVKRIVTMNQIAISYLLKMMKKEGADIFRGKGEAIIQSKARRKIRKAYRGGRVEVWKTGVTNGASAIDCNSLYPYSASIMKFPDLKTEVFWNKPKKEYWEKLLDEVGICRAMIYNEKNEMGLIPIRLPHTSYYPKKGKYLIGTWTNKEIKRAIKEGYKIINIQFIITYREADNPFRKIMPELYKLRKDKTLGGFNNSFYKQIMNGGIGKFAQTRLGQEIVFDSVEKTLEYKEKNYKSLGGIRENSRIVMFRKDTKEFRYKPYYCPIIPALITAEARMIMYDLFKRIGRERLIYTDTDNCVFKGNLEELPKEIKIGENLGEFKPEFENKPVKCWGRKSIEIGDELRMAGISKNEVRNYNKKEGKIKFTRMQGLNKQNTGEFIEEERDLKEQIKEYKKEQEELDEILIYIDESILQDINETGISGKPIDDISYFKEEIQRVNDNTKV